MDYFEVVSDKQQLKKIWHSLPHFFSAGYKNPVEASLNTKGNGYISPMESSLSFVFADGSQMQIEWYLPHVHAVKNQGSEAILTVNGQEVNFAEKTKVSRMNYQLAGITPMFVGALSAQCAEY